MSCTEICKSELPCRTACPNMPEISRNPKSLGVLMASSGNAECYSTSPFEMPPQNSRETNKKGSKTHEVWLKRNSICNTKRKTSQMYPNVSCGNLSLCFCWQSEKFELDHADMSKIPVGNQIGPGFCGF